ncbi:pleckstrin homology domain-containing family A member 4 isoform X2 [Amia ocellicauda]|uniref:pleckstrin homology domain-containing family A member 4 isoform X2 n=1 Tax=Amia ocellicauda TaxID=2972642 RepID=UPI00346441D0
MRMSEADRLSQSSVATISSLPAGSKVSVSKLHSFGKRGLSVRRDPNCPVIIRGWLYKQDSSGLKLWKRRWFVLSDYCLFYYRDSREETVLGSIPLPGYSVLICSTNDSRNKKHVFKAVHAGMRSYVLSADTQEDLLGWVRAMRQCALLEGEGTAASLNRRCSSFQDFTQLGGSADSLNLPKCTPLWNGSTLLPIPSSAAWTEPSQPTQVQGGMPELEQPEKPPNRSKRPERERKNRRSSPVKTTPDAPPASPKFLSAPEERGRSYSQDTDEPLLIEETPSLPPRSLVSRPLTPRGQLGSRPHTPVGRVDVRPQGDSTTTPTRPLTPLSMGLAPPSPQHLSGSSRGHPEVSPASLTPSMDRRHPPHRVWYQGGVSGLLPPLPPSRSAPTSRGNLPVCLPAALPVTSDVYQERETQPIRVPEGNVDSVLTRLCGCDRVLQTLSIEMAQLQADKDSLQCALEMTRLQLEEWRGGQEGIRGQEDVRGQEGVISQQVLLQEELVQTRARICNVSMEMDRVWGQYECMESELSVLRSQLEHICRFGRRQDQSQSHRELWMIEDILCGLSANKNHFRVSMGTPRQSATPMPPSPVLQRPILHPGGPIPAGFAPLRTDCTSLYSGLVSSQRTVKSLPVLPRENRQTDSQTVSLQSYTPYWFPMDTASKVRRRMTPEEQEERLRRNQERTANQKRVCAPAPVNHIQGQRASPPREQPSPPVRVSRVLTSVLPSSLTAWRVSVEDPPLELSAPLPEQIPAAPASAGSPNEKHMRPLRDRAGPSPPATEQTSTTLDLDKDHRGLTMTGGLLGNGRTREMGASPPKVIVRAPLLTYDPSLDPEPSLTHEQQEERQRIRDRVMSAVSCHSLPHQLEGDRQRLISLSFMLANEASRKSREMAARSMMESVSKGRAEACLNTKGPGSSLCHSHNNWEDCLLLNMATKLPSPNPSTSHNTSHNDFHDEPERTTHNTNNVSIPQEPSRPANRVAGLTVFSTNQSSECTSVTNQRAKNVSAPDPSHNTPADNQSSRQHSPANHGEACPLMPNQAAEPITPANHRAELTPQPYPSGLAHVPTSDIVVPSPQVSSDNHRAEAHRPASDLRLPRLPANQKPEMMEDPTNQTAERVVTSPKDVPSNRSEDSGAAANYKPACPISSGGHRDLNRLASGTSLPGSLSGGSDNLPAHARPTNEIHIYEEITYHIFSSRRSANGGEAALQASSSQQPCPHSSAIHKPEHEMTQPSDLPKMPTMANEEQAGTGRSRQPACVTEDTPANQTTLGKELASPDSEFGELSSSQGSAFSKGRLTVLRTSL